MRHLVAFLVMDYWSTHSSPFPSLQWSAVLDHHQKQIGKECYLVYRIHTVAGKRDHLDIYQTAYISHCNSMQMNTINLTIIYGCGNQCVRSDVSSKMINDPTLAAYGSPIPAALSPLWQWSLGLSDPIHTPCYLYASLGLWLPPVLFSAQVSCLLQASSLFASYCRAPHRDSVSIDWQTQRCTSSTCWWFLWIWS